MQRSEARKRQVTAVMLFGLAAGMVGLAFASVPLYRLFCQVTGYGGTPRTENVASPAGILDETIRVRFDANVNNRLAWGFQPMQREVQARLGEEMLVHYTAVNRSDRPVTGTATFNVTPHKAAQYFAKIDCFCFIEQTLQPGESVVMPVLFYIDPALAEDINAEDVKLITLSYTFYRVEGDDADGAATPVAEAAPDPRVDG
jgi:cytochrome c oxidase assembly protein subunit 11